MTSGGLSSVCAKLEPASFKNNEILDTNVLQKFTTHTLCHRLQFMKISKVIRGFFLLNVHEMKFSMVILSPLKVQ